MKTQHKRKWLNFCAANMALRLTTLILQKQPIGLLIHGIVANRQTYIRHYPRRNINPVGWPANQYREAWLKWPMMI